MNASQHFDEDDLALYAMKLLAEPEASFVATYLAESEEARLRLREIQAQLGIFALGTVDLREVPERSLDRLMREITATATKQATPLRGGVPLHVTELREKTQKSQILPWAGWAIAAMLAVTSGALYYKIQTSVVPGAASEIQASAPIPSRGAAQEVDRLQSQLGAQARELQRLSATLSAANEQQRSLRATIAQQTKDAEGTKSQLQQQIELVSSLGSSRDQLTRTVDTQARQVAELSQQTRSAQSLLDALTAKTALRVTLIEPSHQPVPTGQTIYLADKGSLIFQGSHLAPLAPEKVYELWLLPADGSKPIPAGTFTPDARGQASIINAQLANAVPAKGFGVTVENTGGATSPTLPILLLGTS